MARRRKFFRRLYEELNNLAEAAQGSEWMEKYLDMAGGVQELAEGESVVVSVKLLCLIEDAVHAGANLRQKDLDQLRNAIRRSA